jgi:hypothetical protein
MTDAKRGRSRSTPDGLRVAGLDRVAWMAAVAALGLALSGCGHGASSSSAAATAQSSLPAQSSNGGTPGSTGSGSTGSSPPPATINSVTVNWVPPTENTDGSTLTNLAGYNIHYGTASHDYTQVITVSNPGLATYVVSNLTPGTYYFAVAAVNASGIESPMSSEVSATVN